MLIIFSSRGAKLKYVKNNGFLSINLNRLMTQKGLSQQALADLAGVSLHTVFRAVSKGIMPRGGNLGKIAHALGTSETYLLDDPNRPPVTAEIAPNQLASIEWVIRDTLAKQSNPRDAEFLAAFRGADEPCQLAALYWLTGESKYLDQLDDLDHRLALRVEKVAKQRKT